MCAGSEGIFFNRKRDDTKLKRKDASSNFFSVCKLDFVRKVLRFTPLTFFYCKGLHISAAKRFLSSFQSIGAFGKRLLFLRKICSFFPSASAAAFSFSARSVRRESSVAPSLIFCSVPAGHPVLRRLSKQMIFWLRRCTCNISFHNQERAAQIFLWAALFK